MCTKVVAINDKLGRCEHVNVVSIKKLQMSSNKEKNLKEKKLKNKLHHTSKFFKKVNINFK